jgi:hypothetical protein
MVARIDGERIADNQLKQESFDSLTTIEKAKMS